MRADEHHYRITFEVVQEPESSDEGVPQGWSALSEPPFFNSS